MTEARGQLYTDGGARGNPGPAGIGYVLKNSGGEVVENGKQFVGHTTNNAAEYLALILGLEKALARGLRKLDCFLDSELVVRQINGQYRVKEPSLRGLFMKVKNLCQRFEEIRFQNVPREKNRLADRLVNEAVDEAEP